MFKKQTKARDISIDNKYKILFSFFFLTMN